MKAVSGGPAAYAKAFFSPLVLLGVTLLIVWMLSRMTLMSWADLSYILPITAMGYVLVCGGRQAYSSPSTFRSMRWAERCLSLPESRWLAEQGANSLMQTGCWWRSSSPRRPQATFFRVSR